MSVWSLAVTDPRRWFVAALGLLALAAVAVAPSPLNGDTSWLLTVCERMLAGEVFGADILEVNPPASA